MEFIEDLKEKRDRLCQKFPFGLRFTLFVANVAFAILHHNFVAKYGFDDCSEEDCPPLNIWDNPNEWVYPQRAYVQIHQFMMKWWFFWAWYLLIPDWIQATKNWFSVIQQKFGDYYNREQIQEEETASNNEPVSIEMTDFSSKIEQRPLSRSFDESYV